MLGKPKKLVEIENGEYKFVPVSSRIPPNTYKTMKTCMEELGVKKEATYVQMAITLMNQSKSGAR